MIRHCLHIYRAWIADYVCRLVALPVMYSVMPIESEPSAYGEITWKDES